MMDGSENVQGRSVNVSEAMDLIRAGAGDAAGQTWADLGAGEGTFTRALAQLVGNDGRIIAIDRDDAAIRELRRISREIQHPHIDVVNGDVIEVDTIEALRGLPLDGALFANVLHFIENPVDVLTHIRAQLHTHGRVLVIEYEQRAASRWVPHPLPMARLQEAAAEAGFATPVETGRRKSRYQGELYCAILATSSSSR